MGEDKRDRVCLIEEWMRWVMTKGTKMGLKTLICPKNARLYRYRLVRYWYRLPSATFCTSGTGTGVPIFIFILLYIYIYIL